MWKMDLPHVVLSVISDSDQSSDNGKLKTSELEENIKKTISSLVEAAASTSAYSPLCFNMRVSVYNHTITESMFALYMYTYV